MKSGTPIGLQLTGSPHEMGRVHGAVAKDAGALSAVTFYGTLIDSAFGFHASGASDRWMRGKGRALVRELIERPLQERLPARYRDGIRGFCHGSGLPEELLLRAYVMPDAYSYLISQRGRFLRQPNLEQIHLGCTSFVTLGNAELGVPMIHARNLDFPGGQRWSDHPVVIEYVPSDNGQRYAAVTTLGIDTAGITAMNESGLTLSLNMNYSTGVTAEAVPIVVIGHEVMRRATTLEEAVAVVSDFSRSGGWSLLISSVREKNAVAIEFDAAGMSVRGLDSGHIICANQFRDPQLKSREYWITKGRAIDNSAREKRVHDLLSERQFRPTVEDAAKVLSDSWDPFLNQERSYGSTVAQVHTLSSVIFVPSERRIYVAAGKPPLSKRRFHAFDLFPGPVERDSGIGAFASAMDDARYDYALAHEAYFPDEDLVSCATHLRRACERVPQESFFRSVFGILQLKRGEVQDARRFLEEAIALPDTAYRQAQNHLHLARTCDLTNERAKAKEHYARAGEEVYFKTVARRGIRKAFTRADARRFVIDFTLGDAIEPI